VLTRPHPTKPNSGLFFVAPITGPQQIEAARAAELGPALDIAMLCVEGPNRSGMGFDLMSRLAVGGINLPGLSISSLGDRFVAFLAFDNADTANLAIRLLATLEE
jgi:hypothetical protein